MLGRYLAAAIPILIAITFFTALVGYNDLRDYISPTCRRVAKVFALASALTLLALIVYGLTTGIGAI